MVKEHISKLLLANAAADGGREHPHTSHAGPSCWKGEYDQQEEDNSGWKNNKAMVGINGGTGGMVEEG